MWRETRFSFSGRIKSINYPTKKISFILLEGVLKLIFKLWSNNAKIYKKRFKILCWWWSKKSRWKFLIFENVFRPGLSLFSSWDFLFHQDQNNIIKCRSTKKLRAQNMYCSSRECKQTFCIDWSGLSFLVKIDQSLELCHNLIFRQGGVVRGLSGTCTHYGAPLVKGVLGANSITCPWHGACFNTTTGSGSLLTGYASFLF